MIKEIREELATILTNAGIHAFAYGADTISPPCARILPGAPYITTDEAPTGCWVSRLNVVLIVTGDNEIEQDSIDDLIEKAFPAINVGKFNITEVQQPTTVATNAGSYYTATLSVDAIIERI